VNSEQPRRTVVSFVNRGGRMTVGQQRAWDEQWAHLGNDVTALPEGPVDFAGWFDRDAPVLLEIGSGMGETTSVLAANEPEVNYLAVEVYEPGLAQLILRAQTLGVRNLRLLRGDAVTLLQQHVAPDSLNGARIYFPDPWPKKRHHKRRLVQESFVALLASRLTSGARLHLATDWAHYAAQMLEVCSAEPLLRNEFDGYAPRPDWRPRTKFEQRADIEGRESRDIMFTRV
jgi:tRNA (guanine-N7-)-methyltransferase